MVLTDQDKLEYMVQVTIGLFTRGSVVAEVDSQKQQDELLAHATHSKALSVGASNAYFRSLGLPVVWQGSASDRRPMPIKHPCQCTFRPLRSA
jgi:hypothetical protein